MPRLRSLFKASRSLVLSLVSCTWTARRLVVGLAIALVAFAPTRAAAQTLSRQISQSADDAEQQPDNSIYLDSSDLELPQETDCCGLPIQKVGLRFQNITIPQGSTINDARLQFQVDETRPDVAITLLISGEDIDDAPTFTTSANNIGARTKTTANVSWSPPHWPTVDSEGVDQQTSDLSSILQEIVDRGGWAFGNDVVFIIEKSSGTGTRIAESYDGEASAAAQLSIDYTVPPGSDPSASLDDYRSVQTGNWATASSWQRYDGTNWIAATGAPALADNTITIRNGHTVTLSGSDTDIDQLVVEAGGVLVANKKLRIQDGPGTDFQMAGTLTVNSDIEHKGFSTSVYAAGSLIDVQSNRFWVKDDSQVDVYGDLDIASGGDFEVANRSTIHVRAGGTLDLLGMSNLQGDATFRLSGTAVVSSELKLGGNAVFIAENGGVYEHARDGGNLPRRDQTTWNTGSTARITGITSTLPGQRDHAFYTLVWNCPSQTSALTFEGEKATIAGDLQIVSTGSSQLVWTSKASGTIAIGGSYIQSGGTFVYTNGSESGTLDVAGDVTVSGGTFTLATSTGVPTLRVAGDVAITGGGTLGVGSSRTATVIFDGTSAQTFTQTGTIASENIPFQFDNPTTVTALSAIDLPNDVIVSQGTVDFNNNTFSIGNDLTVNGTLVNPSQITFDGTTEQLYDYAAPLSLPRIYVNKASNQVRLVNADLRLSRGITLVSGNFDLAGEPVLLESDGTYIATVFEEGAGGSLLNDSQLSIERDFTGTDGWRFLAVPLTGVLYSTLNGSFHTQGAPWADVAAGEANLRQLDVAIQDWTELNGADANFVPGEGYIFYTWEDDPDAGTILPETWTVTGPLSTVTSTTLAFNTSASDSNNLVGNPWAANLDWDATVVSSTDVGTSYAVWDPSVTSGGGMSGYLYYNSSGGVGAAGPYIPPMTAFSVQAQTSSAALVYETSSAANDGTPVLLGREAGPTAARRSVSPHLRLHLEGDGLGESETYLVFDPEAESGRDAYDVDRLDPLMAAYATLWMEGADGARLAFDGRSMESGQQTYRLHVAATRADTYTLSWPDWSNVPDDWALTLVDLETGREVDLRAADSTSFWLDASEAESRSAARFALQVVDPGKGSRDASSGLVPDVVRLAPNYPNPFRDATAIRYAIPADVSVRLVVYDALGREVDVLVDASQPAGWHTARWDARRHASGTYVYRLTAGQDVRMGTMAVVR